ncbi:hypothetical protein SETIT_6G103700v2 [Setaria italica]|uniref:Uncharacterized protein n=2 Tax=Setaria TaxID=4554 RepID=A0A368RLS3_SETIT|nr:hypothetical protein SETIT_6G103700v2 [Setaria italica]TKW09606.1 hypothetical protein SEVIR_6G113900v2 [Setaria viridis]
MDLVKKNCRLTPFQDLWNATNGDAQNASNSRPQGIYPRECKREGAGLDMQQCRNERNKKQRESYKRKKGQRIKHGKHGS